MPLEAWFDVNELMVVRHLNRLRLAEDDKRKGMP